MAKWLSECKGERGDPQRIFFSFVTYISTESAIVPEEIAVAVVARNSHRFAILQ